MAVSTDSEEVSAGGHWFGAAIPIFSGLLILRSLGAGLLIDEKGVTVRSLFRTRSCRWTDIARFDVGGSWSFMPWQTVTITEIDGTMVNAAGVVEPAPQASDVRRANSRKSESAAWTPPVTYDALVTTVVLDAPIHPVEGGSANDYDYANGDPINQFDLSGLGPCPPLLHRTRSDGSHYCKGNAAASVGSEVWQHMNVAPSVCVAICVGVSIQEGHPSFTAGQIGLSTPGVGIGYANRRPCEREKFAVGGGGGVALGGYGSVGSTGNDVVRDDWEAGIAIRPVGGWVGANRVWTAGC